MPLTAPAGLVGFWRLVGSLAALIVFEGRVPGGAARP